MKKWEERALKSFKLAAAKRAKNWRKALSDSAKRRKERLAREAADYAKSDEGRYQQALAQIEAARRLQARRDAKTTSID